MLLISGNTFFLDLKALEKKLQKLLKSKQNGLWATRLRPEFKNMFGELLPDDIQNIIQEHFLSFIKVDRYIGFIEGIRV